MKNIYRLIAVLLSYSSAVYAGTSVAPGSKEFAVSQAYIKQMVRENLRDPASATFDKIYVCSFNADLKMAVGQVNAKNAFGGYVGNKTFVAMEIPGEKKVLFPEAPVDERNGNGFAVKAYEARAQAGKWVQQCLDVYSRDVLGKSLKN